MVGGDPRVRQGVDRDHDLTAGGSLRHWGPTTPPSSGHGIPGLESERCHPPAWRRAPMIARLRIAVMSCLGSTKARRGHRQPALSRSRSARRAWAEANGLRQQSSACDVDLARVAKAGRGVNASKMRRQCRRHGRRPPSINPAIAGQIRPGRATASARIFRSFP